jgi:hypothetical protein
MLRRPSKTGNAVSALYQQARPRPAHVRLLSVDRSSGFTLANGFKLLGGGPISINDHPAHRLIHRTRGRAAIEDPTRARERHPATQQKFRLHLTPVWEGDSNPDTTRRVKRGQPAAKRRFSEGIQLYLNLPQRQAGPAARCLIDTIANLAHCSRVSKNLPYRPRPEIIAIPTVQV